MMLRKPGFPFWVALLFGFFNFVLIFTEFYRVAPQLQFTYLVLKISYGVVGLFFAIYLYFNEPKDRAFSLLMTMLASYCLTQMWFAPLYEIAYLEFAVASSFLPLRRQWILPVIFGSCMVGMFATYEIQDHIGWTLPPIHRSDWYITIILFFLAAWYIQTYALGAYRKEQDRLSRFSVIGKEATRLTHDIKGLLSSPLMLIESLKIRRQVHPEEFEKHIRHLTDDMNNVREVIKSIHRLVQIEEREAEIEITQAISTSLKVLERRMAFVKVTLPEPRRIIANPDLLHSIFFNLLLNSIEAFEQNKTKNPEINISWKNCTLFVKDNAGGLREQNEDKPHGSGLGLGLVRSDLEQLGAKLKIHSSGPHTCIEITFSSSMFRC